MSISGESNESSFRQRFRVNMKKGGRQAGECAHEMSEAGQATSGIGEHPWRKPLLTARKQRQCRDDLARPITDIPFIKEELP